MRYYTNIINTLKMKLFLRVVLCFLLLVVSSCKIRLNNTNSVRSVITCGGNNVLILQLMNNGNAEPKTIWH